jgi:tetratricopeptide (TPR) repeat protein
MPKSNKEIRELLDCLKTDVDSYIASLEKGKDDFTRHSRESVLPLLKKKGLLCSFESQLTKYVRVLDAKTISTFHNFESSIRKLWSDLEQISSIQKYTPKKGARVEHFLIESFKFVYVDFSNLLMIASQMFLALEFYCRILCALGCVKFALKVARDEIVQHRDLWEQLKRFSNKSCPSCETCLVFDTCESKIDFGALARIYVYSMKVRQIADYTPKLVSLDIFKSGLIEPPLTYFLSVHSLLKENMLFYDCLAEFVPTIGYGRKELLKELRSPFIWGDEDRLKEAIREKEDKGFYNYLLGRFYYEKNRFEEAIKSLERAKKTNPNNAEVWNLLGTIYDAQAETKKDLEKALEYLKRARDLAPSDNYALCKVGILELSLDRYSSAIDNLAKACDHATTDFDRFLAFLIISEAYRMKGIIGESDLYLRKSQQIRKDTDTSLKWLRKYIEERRKAK